MDLIQPGKLYTLKLNMYLTKIKNDSKKNSHLILINKNSVLFCLEAKPQIGGFVLYKFLYGNTDVLVKLLLEDQTYFKPL